VRSFRERYGHGPLHLLALLTSLTVCAYALTRAFDELPTPLNFAVWFGGAILAHDLVLLPLYSLLGLLAGGVLLPDAARSRVRIAALNHLRAPALLSGLLLLVWFPLILDVPRDPSFELITGIDARVYLERWLLLSAALFAGSAVLFALRVRRLPDPEVTSPLRGSPDARRRCHNRLDG
jgi:hypothetical protein